MTTSADATIREATPADAPALFRLINALAEFERLAHEVVGSEAQLEADLSSRHCAALIAEDAGDPVGFALYFHNYSTFLARRGLYLEDLFVRPDHRRRGLGRRLLQRLAQIAVERGCGRFEWAVLDWNEDAIRFYRSLGALPQDEWTVFRVTGDALRQLGQQP